jgi:hypothetical protein
MDTSLSPNNWQQALIGHPSIQAPTLFWLKLFLLAIAIRFIAFVLRAINLPVNPLLHPFWKPILSRYFSLDHIHPFILGLLELAAYPVLMVSGGWTVIGAWIGLKTVAQWERWSKERNIFNLFLINNALVVMTSYVFLVQHISFAGR